MYDQIVALQTEADICLVELRAGLDCFKKQRLNGELILGRINKISDFILQESVSLGTELPHVKPELARIVESSYWSTSGWPPGLVPQFALFRQIAASTYSLCRLSALDFYLLTRKVLKSLVQYPFCQFQLKCGSALSNAKLSGRGTAEAEKKTAAKPRSA